MNVKLLLCLITAQWKLVEGGILYRKSGLSALILRRPPAFEAYSLDSIGACFREGFADSSCLLDIAKFSVTSSRTGR
jgi:hypothetical protein